MIKELAARAIKLRDTIAELEETLKELKKEAHAVETELELTVRTGSVLIELEGRDYAVVSRSYDVVIIPLKRE
jgi:cell division protein FtsB